MPDEPYPPMPEYGMLHDLWNSAVKDLVVLPDPKITPEWKERHTLYSLLLMALVAWYWNGNKRGRKGKYPWRERQMASDDEYRDGDYLGHNIAGLAVDGRGEVMDFDFNHNDILNSSVEHAESRLIRRLFSLAQIFDGWATDSWRTRRQRVPYATLLNDVTVYTSLESCSQCSGIMALGLVKEVVFLQRDPGQSSIGNILRKLSWDRATDKYLAPLPIPADKFGLDFFTRLNDGFAHFRTEVVNKPFYVPRRGRPDRSPSITSFLCTDEAWDIFQEALDEFDGKDPTTLSYQDFVPKGPQGRPISGALTNAQVLVHLKGFYNYAITNGSRGTPHKL